MAIVVAQQAVNFDVNPPIGLNIVQDHTTVYSNMTDAGFTATNGNVEVDFIGSGFSGAAATISAISVRIDGAAAYSLTGLNLNYDDYQDGIGYDPLEFVLHLDGSDSFTGSQFADRFYGDGGEDVLRGRGGADLLD